MTSYAYNFPPSFAESPWAYGISLFGMFLISVVAIGLLLGIVLEPRHRRRIDAELDNIVVQSHDVGFTSALDLYKFKISMLLLTIIIGCMPDVIFLLAWGEASAETMSLIYGADRILDGMALLPFLGFVLTYFLANGTIAQQLADSPQQVSLIARWPRVRHHLKAAFLVLFIAVGVTYYKAMG